MSKKTSEKILKEEFLESLFRNQDEKEKEKKKIMREKEVQEIEKKIEENNQKIKQETDESIIKEINKEIKEAKRIKREKEKELKAIKKERDEAFKNFKNLREEEEEKERNFPVIEFADWITNAAIVGLINVNNYGKDIYKDEYQELLKKHLKDEAGVTELVQIIKDEYGLPVSIRVPKNLLIDNTFISWFYEFMLKNKIIKNEVNRNKKVSILKNLKNLKSLEFEKNGKPINQKELMGNIKTLSENLHMENKNEKKFLMSLKIKDVDMKIFSYSALRGGKDNLLKIIPPEMMACLIEEFSNEILEGKRKEISHLFNIFDKDILNKINELEKGKNKDENKDENKDKSEHKEEKREESEKKNKKNFYEENIKILYCYFILNALNFKENINGYYVPSVAKAAEINFIKTNILKDFCSSFPGAYKDDPFKCFNKDKKKDKEFKKINSVQSGDLSKKTSQLWNQNKDLYRGNELLINLFFLAGMNFLSFYEEKNDKSQKKGKIYHDLSFFINGPIFFNENDELQIVKIHNKILSDIDDNESPNFYQIISNALSRHNFLEFCQIENINDGNNSKNISRTVYLSSEDIDILTDFESFDLDLNNKQNLFLKYLNLRNFSHIIKDLVLNLDMEDYLIRKKVEKLKAICKIQVMLKRKDDESMEENQLAPSEIKNIFKNFHAETSKRMLTNESKKIFYKLRKAYLRKDKNEFIQTILNTYINKDLLVDYRMTAIFMKEDFFESYAPLIMAEFLSYSTPKNNNSKQGGN